MIRITLFILIGAMLCSCNNKPERLSSAKMQAVMWDVIQLEVYYQQLMTKDSLKKDSSKILELQQKVFALHGVTKEQYFTSYDYYSTHPDYMRIILDSMTSNAQQNRSIIMQKKYGKDKNPR